MDYDDAKQEILHVRSQATGLDLFEQPVSKEWFSQELIGRTVRAAAIADPDLQGRCLIPQLQRVLDGDSRVVGWRATLSSNGDVLFARRWSVTVLQATAMAVGQQYQAWLGDGRVLYWVSLEARENTSGPQGGAIEFDSDDGDGAVVVPDITMERDSLTGRVVAAAADYPLDAVLELNREAFEELAAGIGDSRYAETELAWVGTTRVGYLPRDETLVYRLDSLKRLAAPDATATLCPVSAEELVGVLHPEQPVVFIHTHVVPEDWSNASDNRILSCSHDDLRCFRRLPVGSIGVIAGSRPPLRVRVYGWPRDGGDLAELITSVTLNDS